jgi:IS4 transposase
MGSLKGLLDNFRRKMVWDSIYIVTRMRNNFDFGVLTRWWFPDRGPVQRDEIIFDLCKLALGDSCDVSLRRIPIWYEAQGRNLVLITNQRGFAAPTIATTYRQRGGIELFFKERKQNLRINTFVGTNANALQVQIWTALDAIGQLSAFGPVDDGGAREFSVVAFLDGEGCAQDALKALLVDS